MKTIFFLGGHDLEMLTIKEVLIEFNQEFLDKDLGWDNATLDKYEEELKEYTEMGYKTYGIELRNTGLDLPDNYFAIDHHNQKEDAPSSLEQVCEVLGKTMDRRLQLISANDKAYIQGMKALGASDKEINDIRIMDRMAQGVTDEEEDAAKKVSIKDEFGLQVVEFNFSHFSPVIDKLYRPGSRILIYSDSHFTYYGKYRDRILNTLKKLTEFSNISFYQGGGVDGFMGAGPLDKDTINKIVDSIISQKYYSGHVFLFPFSWAPQRSKSDNPLDSISEKLDSQWRRMPLSNELYNERNFFLPFTHDSLYDGQNQERPHSIMHLERKETSNHERLIEYLITINKVKKEELPEVITYKLEVEDININFYKTGVGVLSIYTKNASSEYKEPDDILAINQFGRRLFPPFMADIYNHDVTPISLSIKGLDEEYEVAFNSSCIRDNTPASFIKKIISSAVDNLDDAFIHPILDDRMFVMSWFKDSIHSIGTQDGYESFFDGRSDFLYKYVFVDSGSSSCQNDQMQRELLKNAIYPRWQRYGTLYGVSRYSFTMLTTPLCPDFLIDYFETMYVRLLELVLVQRATILHYSELLTAIGDNNYESFDSLYSGYIDFLNTLLYPEVTAQEQGIELYDMLQKTMKIKEHAEHLDNQINERQEYYELLNQRKLNEEQRFLSILAGIAIPVSVLSALFGFLFHDPFDSTSFHKLRSDLFTIPGTWMIVLSLLLTIALLWDISRGEKSWTRRILRWLFKKA